MATSKIENLNSNFDISNQLYYRDSEKKPPIYRKVPASDIATFDVTVPEAKYGIITGFAIESNIYSTILQCYMTSKTSIHVRVKNTSSSETSVQLYIKYI
jgi:hypothetical protein